ncbi:HAD family hydrolase [Pseudarthrobacter sp. NPDC058362]|uniref:HAD family hydrolase n=1 Tax=Pseudarthrobacter sp. NPDC058362 TaxID=3346458 RepID=UPI003647AD55
MEIRAVLFDLDDTLFDHQASSRAAVHTFLGQLGLNRSEELTRAWFDIENRVFDRFLAKQLSLQEHRRERLRQFLPLTTMSIPKKARQLDELFVLFLENYEDAWTAFPDAALALRTLNAAGVPVAVVTNGVLDQQSAKVRKIGLGPFVNQVFSSDATGYAKPAPEAFLKPCMSMQVSPAQGLYVGDNYRVDVEGAQNAGLHAIFLDREGPRHPGSIQSLSDLPPLLSGRTAARTVRSS